MEAKLIRIGNSRGVRLPALAIKQAGLGDVVLLEVRKGVVTIRPAKATRAGWAESAKRCHDQGADRLLLGEVGNDFDSHW